MQSIANHSTFAWLDFIFRDGNSVINKEKVLITGPTSGIGLELARLFAMNNYELILVGRNRQKLIELQRLWKYEFNSTIHMIEEDLALPDAAKKIIQTVSERGLSIDILVNNAGFGAYGPFTQTSLTKELEMIQVNVIALTSLTKLVSCEMVKQGNGKILNLSSVAGFQPGGPLMAVYYATKAYVLSFSEALANELEEAGVQVSVLCPGPTATRFEKRANLEQSKLFQRNIMTAEEVARIAFREFMRGKRLIVPGTTNRILARSVRFLPRKVVTGMVRRIQEERNPDQ
ncbi:hypothetical protein SAMN05444392_11434 [Seinonella peptonophila]|uniref:Short-chain dehydrogenase n=1 Tax=Seinonella peptonophila TaxID=112248 RepID=A0A1M5AJ98_9BACL|nr:SDR family oxidoreductase [Seinonella peptonophila]SHF30225.1 hypothetical protein SAMN05444392_11434 [Seinonella peptonophila]